MGKFANEQLYRQWTQREPDKDLSELECEAMAEWSEYVEAPLDTEQRGEMTC